VHQLSAPAIINDISQPTVVIFDLHTPPNFEKVIDNTGGIQRKGTYKTREPLSALDDDHARIASYAHQLRVILAHSDDLLKFEEICHRAKCQPLPTRFNHHLDVYAMHLFRDDFIDIVSDWIKSLGCWKSAFQIESCVRYGLLNTYDLLVSLRKPIEAVIRDYASGANDLLRLFSVALRTRAPSESLSACLARVRVEYPKIKPLNLASGKILCHHAVITPSRILLEGPYVTQSNRVIRHYQTHDPSLIDYFLRVEFRDEDLLSYRWDYWVDSTSFLQKRIGRILHEGLEIGGRMFKFLAYSNSSLRDHTVWFVARFRDPIDGFVTANRIRASLGDFSKLLRTPSKYGSRIALAFTATEPSVKIRRGQWEEMDELGPHTDGVGTISPILADMIWEEKCKAKGYLRENRVKPSAYQFRFRGYKGVVVVDSRLEGIKLCLRKSQRKFLVHDKQAEFEIARTFDYPNPVHLNRFVLLYLL
jgi:RNA-dependent RNA polymerase